MRLLVVGTLPPPGGLDARRFAREVARRSAEGDSVETLSGNPLSISHQTVVLRGRHLARELRARSDQFEAVELRVEPALGLTSRSAGKVAMALRRFQHVTLFMDSPTPLSAGDRGVRSRLWSSADTVVYANEADLESDASLPNGPERIVVPPEPSDLTSALPPWPASGSSQEAVLGVIRIRARVGVTGANRSERTSMLVTASERVHPSFKGSSIWLAKRVIGKSRGAVTKILRPTPRKAT